MVFDSFLGDWFFSRHPFLLLFRSLDPDNTGCIEEFAFRKIMKNKEGVSDNDINEMIAGENFFFVGNLTDKNKLELSFSNIAKKYYFGQIFHKWGGVSPFPENNQFYLPGELDQKETGLLNKPIFGLVWSHKKKV